MDNLNISNKSINDSITEKRIYIDREWIDIDKSVGIVSDVIIHMNEYSISKLVGIEDSFTLLLKNKHYNIVGNSIVLYKEFISLLREGKNFINFIFNDDEEKKICINIIEDKDSRLDLIVGKSNGEREEKVIVPVMIEGITENKLNAFNFSLSFDNNRFSNIKIFAGNICVNPEITLFVDINEKIGIISIMYCDSVGDGSEAIYKDGVFIEIEMDIKEDASFGDSEIKMNQVGIFADINDSLYNLNFKPGIVTVDGLLDAEIVNPTTSFDLNDFVDVYVDIVFNENILENIILDGMILKENMDYFINGSTIVFVKEFLQALGAGRKEFIFRFEQCEDAFLYIDIFSGSRKIKVEVDEVSGEKGKRLVVPVSIDGIREEKLSAFNFALSYDNSKFKNVSVVAKEICVNSEVTLFSDVNEDKGIISIMYCDSKGDGSESIYKNGNFVDIEFDVNDEVESSTSNFEISDSGVFVDSKDTVYDLRFISGDINISEPNKSELITDLKEIGNGNLEEVEINIEKGSTLETIKDVEVVNDILEENKESVSSNLLNLNVCSVLGKQGAKVTVPIILKGITDKKLSTFNFSLKYDINKLEDVKVLSQGSCINPQATLFSSVNNDAGIISIMYCDSTGTGTEAIYQDGVFVSIEFRIKENSEIGISDITLNKLGVFTDSKGGLYDVNFIGGSISIAKSKNQDSTLNKNFDKFDKEDPFDIVVDMNLNSNSLLEILNRDEILLKGRDYLVEDEKVIIMKEYLDILPLGDEVLTFKFNSGKDQLLMINIDKSKPKMQDAEIDINSSVFDLVNPIDIKIKVLLNGNSFMNIKHGALTLDEGKDYFLDGNTIILSERYLEAMDTGVKLLNINFVSGQSIPFTINIINSTEDRGNFSINIPSIEAKAGDTIIVPVYVRGTPKQGVEAFDFRISYEGQFLDVINVKAGDVIINADRNLKYYSNTKRHLIYVTYIDYECLGNDAIKGDGVLLYVTFKIKEETSRGPVKIGPNNDDPVFSDFKGNNYDFEFNGGILTII